MSGNESQQNRPPLPPRPGDAANSPDDRGNGHRARPSWTRRLNDWSIKASAPLNTLTNRMGSEAFLPSNMDQECEKAARILKSFCKDGVYGDSAGSSAAGPNTSSTADGKAKSKSRVLLTIPPKVIARAQGLLIFTTMRMGFHWTGAGGTGVLVSRLPDGSWSPPSGVFIHTLGAGFVIGVDIYDCVVVINTREALEAFTRTRLSLGSDLAVAAGPWGAGGMVDWGLPRGRGKGKGEENWGEVGDEKPAQDVANTKATNKPAEPPSYFIPPPPPSTFDQPQAQTTGRQQSTSVLGDGKERKPSTFRDTINKPVYSYVKSRGFYAGVAVDGTIVVERSDANAEFYGERVPVADILAGRVRPQPGPGQWPTGARGLLEVLAGAGGWSNTIAQDQRQQSRRRVDDVEARAAAASSTAAAATGATQGPYPRYATKAAEAEAEACEIRPTPDFTNTGPPAYEHPSAPPEDLPPAYVDDDQVRPSLGENKNARHW